MGCLQSTSTAQGSVASGAPPERRTSKGGEGNESFNNNVGSAAPREGLKEIVEKRVQAKRALASSTMAAKLDRVTGIANQRIIGNYSVVDDYEKDKVCGDGLNGAVWKAKLLENPKWPAAQK